MSILVDRLFLNILQAIIACLGAFLFSFFYFKERKMKFWVISSFCLALGMIPIIISNFDDSIRIIAMLFFALTAISVIFAVIDDYYKVFLKDKNNSFRMHQKIVTTVIVSPVLLSLEIFMIIIVLTCIVLQLKICFKKKRPLYIFQLITIIEFSITTFFLIPESFNVPGGQDMLVGLSFLAILLHSVTGLVAVLDHRITESEHKYRRAYDLTEFYKDIFAHDIGNILQVILSSIDLSNLYEKEIPEELNDIFSIIAKQVKRGANLISNVRDLSTIETKYRYLHSTDICISLKKVIKNVKLNHSDKQISLEVNNQSVNTMIKANELLNRVFENLLINSVEHNKHDQIKIQINISNIIKNKEVFLKMEFIDNGIDIEDERKKEIFEREFKKDSTIEGIGLGLSLIKRIIDHFNGKIYVENKNKNDYSEGSIFVIEIPQQK